MSKVALITGGSRGIGLGIARCLAKEGCDIVVCGRSPEESVKDALDGLRSQGADLLYCVCDISSADDRANMLTVIKDKFGQLNVLVNNAGIAPPERKDVLEATEYSFDTVMNVNLKGPYFLTQAAANWMVEMKEADADFEASIINITSISSDTASVNRGEYCIAKAGLSMTTELWAVRLSEFGIPVYEVRPGIIMTDMTSGVKEKYDKLIAEGLLLQKRWGEPEDIGKAVAMLARGDMPYSTGSVLMVDGGFSVSRL